MKNVGVMHCAYNVQSVNLSYVSTPETKYKVDAGANGRKITRTHTHIRTPNTNISKIYMVVFFSLLLLRKMIESSGHIVAQLSDALKPE